MTNERIKTLEERAEEGLDQIQSVIEHVKNKSGRISSTNSSNYLLPFFGVFLSDQAPNEGEAYKRGKEIITAVLEEDMLEKLSLDEEEEKKKRKNKFKNETSDTMLAFVRDFVTFKDQILQDKNSLEASFAYCSLYFRSLEGDEKTLNKALEILGNNRCEEAMEIYNQGFNFQDISDPEDADGLRDFVRTNIVQKLSAIRRYNELLLRMTERKELENVKYLACFYIDESSLSLDLYKEGRENLVNAIQYNKEEKLTIIDWIFPEIREDGAYFKDGETVLFSVPEDSIKTRTKYLEQGLKEEGKREFPLYFTGLY
jgi:hypothetical protein